MIRISNIRERNSLGETDKKFDMEIDGKKYNCHQNYNRKDFSIVITNDKKNEVFKMNYNEEFYPGDKSTKLEINKEIITKPIFIKLKANKEFNFLMNKDGVDDLGYDDAYDMSNKLKNKNEIDIKISNVKQKKNSFSYDETFDVTINGEKYFCTKEDIKDFSYSIILKDKNNEIVIEDSFNNDSYVDDNVIFWVDKHKIPEELYNQIKMNEHFSTINDKKVLQSDYIDAYDNGIDVWFKKQHENEQETDIQKFNLSRNQDIYLFKQNNNLYIVRPDIYRKNLESYKISCADSKGIINGLCYVRKECESSENKTITSYDYNLLKPINKDVLQKINDYFDFHLSNRQIKNIKIYEYNSTSLKDYTISFKDKNCYISTDKSHFDITITHNNLFKTIYKSDKQNLVGTEIDKTEYNPELFTKEIWTKICDVIGDDINAKPYEDMIKNANVINKEKNIENHEKER